MLTRSWRYTILSLVCMTFSFICTQSARFLPTKEAEVGMIICGCLFIIPQFYFVIMAFKTKNKLVTKIPEK